jgi:predicted Zn finger-like uncharacterized protein
MADEITLTCPACSATLRLAQEVPAGKKVKCPKCGVTFTPGEELIDEAVIAEESVEAVRPARRARDDDDYDDRPRRRRRDDYDDDYDDRPRRRKPATRRSPIATVLILLAVIFLPIIALGGLYGLYALMSRQDKSIQRKEPAAAAPGGGPNLADRPQPQGQAPQVGKPAPEITGEDIDGKKFNLSDYKGKVVVLDFWGHW